MYNNACLKQSWMHKYYTVVSAEGTIEKIKQFSEHELEITNLKVFATSFLKSIKADHAVLNDFNAYDAAEILKEEWDYDVDFSLRRSLENHSWYLSSKFITLSLSDQALEISTKFAMRQRLISFPIPDKAWKYLQSLLCVRGLSHFLYQTRPGNTTKFAMRQKLISFPIPDKTW